TGYYLLVLRNAYEGNATPLPAWTNFGELFTKGISAVVGVLIWSLPVIILACCAALTGIVTGNAASNDTSGSSAAATLGGLVMACLYCLMLVVGIAISVFVYAPLTNFALTNQISTFWDFQGNWRFIRTNAGNYATAFLLALV